MFALHKSVNQFVFNKSIEVRTIQQHEMVTEMNFKIFTKCAKLNFELILFTSKRLIEVLE